MLIKRNTTKTVAIQGKLYKKDNSVKHYSTITFITFVIITVFFFRYILTLITDGLRNIQSFHFDKAAGSVLASCVSLLYSFIYFQL